MTHEGNIVVPSAAVEVHMIALFAQDDCIVQANSVFSIISMCCFTTLPQVCCGVKGTEDVTTNEPDHMDNEPIKYSSFFHPHQRRVVAFTT